MAAAPTLASVATAFFLSQQASPALAAQTAAPRQANLDAASQPSLTWAQLATAARQAKAEQATTSSTSRPPHLVHGPGG